MDWSCFQPWHNPIMVDWAQNTNKLTNQSPWGHCQVSAAAPCHGGGWLVMGDACSFSQATWTLLVFYFKFCFVFFSIPQETSSSSWYVDLHFVDKDFKRFWELLEYVFLSGSHMKHFQKEELRTTIQNMLLLMRWTGYGLYLRVNFHVGFIDITPLVNWLFTIQTCSPLIFVFCCHMFVHLC